MKISIDTEQDSFASAIQTVHAAYGLKAPVGDPTGPAEGVLPGGWTRETLRRLAEWVGADESAIALRYIAMHAPSVGVDETIEHVRVQTNQPKFDGRAMGGKMSTIGKGRNRFGDGLTGPVDKDDATRNYRMDQEVATVLLEEMDAVGKA